MNKKLFSALCASALILSLCTACGEESDSSSKAESSASSTTTTTAGTVEPVTTEPTAFEEAVVAESGDAFLYIADSQWYVQYDGTADSLMTYDAGVTKITGDGDYTVSVNSGTKGCLFDITGDANGEYQCESISVMLVKVVDGTKLFPNMSIKVNEIRVDGKVATLTAKNYTSSDDGVEMRANICNPYVTDLTKVSDAHDENGPIAGKESDYSATIIDLAEFTKWNKIEVDFTVSGCGEETAADQTDAPAETTTTAAQ